ncbi:hypothetical protein AMES_5720 [Amycolatopsis mediterranei S699]|uniref:Uncharacterized protein n=2 Tax=Amycolatopsis mediterranei TaxID=33910 RepID=A0A0H3D959_AMYMU|nr:hypothetical protein [Amycolatopsis mediterranei]ADJ47545.1 conserved hypothetical protein [Amycolatopsis mediterranei U32]AEK44412.1 hypothetical protein RAM_29685 [Amycolatopsis mediterranei S699]AFO79256.1 hypothetical protein AMES_5720 [Amycolatopsis mediterranei S699]AGT86384.1 hypothetical protein B737_5720 [Amycolatopsis mediterranei RB]KDO12834.1 hypothetical protein DV26_00150 [Amycolatopsis mediterranei]
MEIAKLIVAALTPLSVALIGVVLTRSMRRLEHSNWLNQKLIEKRIEVLGEALPKLNDLYCYFSWIGTWASLSPVDVLQRKRDLDRLFHANRAFFTSSAFDVYGAFIDLLFETYAQPGKGARLRTEMTSHNGNRADVYPKKWEEGWSEMFSGVPRTSSLLTVKKCYEGLVMTFSAEVGIERSDAVGR